MRKRVGAVKVTGRAKTIAPTIPFPKCEVWSAVFKGDKYIGNINLDGNITLNKALGP